MILLPLTFNFIYGTSIFKHLKDSIKLFYYAGFYSLRKLKYLDSLNKNKGLCFAPIDLLGGTFNNVNRLFTRRQIN